MSADGTTIEVSRKSLVLPGGLIPFVIPASSSEWRGTIYPCGKEAICAIRSMRFATP